MFLVPHLSADAWLSGIRREAGSEVWFSRSAGGVLGRVTPGGFGGDRGHDRQARPAGALTPEHMGARCVREVWCRRSSSVKHASRSHSSFFRRIPMERLRLPACFCANKTEGCFPLKTMTVTQVFSTVPPASGQVDLPPLRPGACPLGSDQH